MSDNPYHFEPLGERHLPLRTDFSCGITALDEYLRERARKEMQQGIAAAHVLYDSVAERIAGYYTLSATSVEPRHLPDEVTKRLPRYPVLPAIQIGRLAVDTRYRGRGLGRLLLIDAMRRGHDLKDQIAAFAMIVDAKDDETLGFYERYGFRRFIRYERRLFIPMRTIEKALQTESSAID